MAKPVEPSNSRAAAAILQMIQSGELLPGQQLRQDHLATQLGMSRIPIRESLLTLAADGVLHHEPNVGFTVRRLDITELHQVYLMRRMLEDELLKSIERPTPAGIAELETIHSRMEQAAAKAAMADMIRNNRQFHFAVFDLSPHKVIQAVLLRLWDMTEHYRLAYLSSDAAQQRVLLEHRLFIQLVADYDVPGLIKLSDDHRTTSETSTTELIRWRGGAFNPLQVPEEVTAESGL